MKVKNDHRGIFSNLSNWKEEAWKKLRASTGSEPVTSAIPVRCSTNWAMKPHIGSDVNLSSSYLPVGNEMMWCIYETIHIWTAVVDESEEWSSQYILLYMTLCVVRAWSFSRCRWSVTVNNTKHVTWLNCQCIYNSCSILTKDTVNKQTNIENRANGNK